MRRFFDPLWLYRKLRPLHIAPREELSFSRRLTLEFGGTYYSRLQYFLHGCFIPLGATIGDRPRFMHQYRGVYIADRAVIGDDVTLFHNVTIGASFGKDMSVKAAPVVGNRVLLGANVTLIGDCQIGDDARIGAGVTLVDAHIPAGATVINRSAYNLTDDRPVYP